MKKPTGKTSRPDLSAVTGAIRSIAMRGAPIAATAAPTTYLRPPANAWWTDAHARNGGTGASVSDRTARFVSDELLTLEQCAAKAKCHPKTLKREILRGRLKATRIGALVRIRPEHWEEYLCRSGATEQAGKFAYSMGAGDLARLLRLDQMPSISRQRSGKDSTTPGQVVPLPTPSKKRSTAG